jgi:hypothetical protein
MAWLSQTKILNPGPITYLRVACSILALSLFGNMFWAGIVDDPHMSDYVISIGSAVAFLLLWVKISLLTRKQWVLLDNTLYISGVIWMLQTFRILTSEADTLSKLYASGIFASLGFLALISGTLERKFIQGGMADGTIVIRSDITDEYRYSGERVQVAEATIPAILRRKFVVSAAGISFLMVSLLTAQIAVELPLMQFWPIGGAVTGVICLLAPYSPARWPTIWSWSYFVSFSDHEDKSIQAGRVNSAILWAYFALMTAAFWFWVVLREERPPS